MSLDWRRFFHPRVYQENATARLGEGVWDFDHFLRAGLELGISPTPYFDSAHAVPEGGHDPTLADWLGGSGRRSPHPLVDLDLVGRQLGTGDRADILARLTAGEGRLLRLHPLFWGEAYVAAHPRGDDIRHPLHHYLNRGWRHGHEPNPFFAGDRVPEGDPGDERAPALRWLDSDGALVPTAMFDPVEYARQASIDGGPRDAYLHFLDQGVWADLRPSDWFDIDLIREQAGPTSEPAIVHYLRGEHLLKLRPSEHFDPQNHADLVHRATEFGGRVLERFLSPAHNPQYRRRPVALSLAVDAQLQRLATIAPEIVDSIRQTTDSGHIRTNTNTFTSTRMVAYRLLASAVRHDADDITVQASGRYEFGVNLGAIIRAGATAEDAAAALVELVRVRRVPVIIVDEHAARILASHLKVLVTWAPVASAWPQDRSRGRRTTRPTLSPGSC